MYTTFKIAAAAALLLGTASIASAAISVGFDIGNVAIGYSDGYMDNAHHFHKWGRGEAAQYRAAHADMYHGWRHNDKRHHD